MHSSEIDVGVTPPVSLAPVSRLARPFETCRANGSLESILLNDLIALRSELLNQAESNLCSCGRAACIDHPFWLIEHFNGVDLVLEIFLLNPIEHWLESIVKIRLSCSTVLNHVSAWCVVSTLETEQGQNDLNALILGNFEIVNGILNKFSIKLLEFVVVPKFELLVTVKVNPLTVNIGTTCGIVAQISLEIIGLFH